jgi:hypothetical protein
LVEDDTPALDLVRDAICNRRADDDEDELYSDFLARAADLRRFGPDAVEAAQEVFRGGTTDERDGAADLLGRLVFEAPQPLRDACFDSLVELLHLEQAGPDDPQVIAAIGYALGHLEDDRAMPHLIRLADHTSEEVRLAAASALPNAMGWQIDRPYPNAVETLVRLSGDADEDVRDWATFGLVTTGADGPEVRSALVVRLDDPHEDTRAEAFMALAKLRDDRVVVPLLAELDRDTVGTLEVEAAGESADSRFFPTLTRIAEWWHDEGDLWKVQRALNRCDPSLRASAPTIEQRLAEVVSEGLSASDAPAAAVSIVGSYPDTRLVVNFGDPTGQLDWRVWEDTDPIALDPEDFGAMVVAQALRESQPE